MAEGAFFPVEPDHARKMEATLRSMDLESFVGGQAEIHLEGGILQGGKVFRGDIAAIAIEDEHLVLRYAWLGVMEKLAVWRSEADLDIRLAILLIASCTKDAQRRVLLQAPIVDQLVVLFPPDYTVDREPSRLPRSVIE